MAKKVLKNFAEREAAISASEQIMMLREKALSLRENNLLAQTEAATSHAVLNALNQNQLQEANERLVVSSIHAQQMTEAAELATAQISHMAEHDILTGLPNRALMTDRLMQSITLAERHGKQVALMFIDIDHFKHINDSLGHEVGDKLLLSIAKRLQTGVRLSDTVSRHGGDEFVVLLSEVSDKQDAIQIAEKLLNVMVEPHQISGNLLRVTMSIGISIYPHDGKDAQTMIRNADTAMYQAKKSGRNNYQLFASYMNVRAVARQSIEQALHRALEQDAFVLHYQPKVNLKTGHITGAEALIRWQRSEHQLVYPIDFIDIAEDCGLILPIGRWVLHEACQQAQYWLQCGLNLNQIAINVSSKQLHNKDFVPSVRAILQQTGLNPKYLEIELTESGLMQDTETTELLHAIKALGVQIAVDDFGTGYSCLSYLRHFPIDTLKIDKSFVQDIQDGTGEAIVSAIIAMGLSLKHRIVAEGIETQEQMDFLKTLNCAEGQGHFFSQALSAEDFAKLLVQTPKS
ncbi:MAG TPA: EAL domain-containing protein [Methylotenera sp.]|nr:EAL domain-containing protein [Methylotenera sp.]